jgi:hypothetical protein
MFAIASTRSGKNGAGCNTPITRTGSPSSRSSRPTMPESAPKRVTQRSCVRTITGGASAPSSPGRVRRPSTGESPITSKKLPVTSPRSSRSTSCSPCSVPNHDAYSAMPPNDVTALRKSRTSGTEKRTFSPPAPSLDCRRYSSRSPSRCGSGLRSTPRTTLKIAVFAPMPRARVSTTTSENTGAWRRARQAYRMSRATPIDPWEPALVAHRLDGLGHPSRLEQRHASRLVR